MDYLLAKIKGRNGGLSMVLSDETVFDCVPDFSNARATMMIISCKMGNGL